jgi:hypothetical protein
VGEKPMNFFERLKLKTTLRNCDYKLAGKVIRQQFYVTGRDAEINKLIDEYDTNPSLEAAIKLIDYNEMLVARVVYIFVIMRLNNQMWNKVFKLRRT